MLIPHLGVVPEFFRLCGCCSESPSNPPRVDLENGRLKAGNRRFRPLCSVTAEVATRLCCCVTRRRVAVPKSDLQVTEALSPHSIRYGREIGAILLIFIEAMAYAATSPIILPFALLYFCAAWVHWRYNILYISERCYESGGRAWDMTFQCMVWILFIFELFTGARFPL